jgi:transposase
MLSWPSGACLQAPPISSADGGRQQLAELRLLPISQSRLEANLRIIDELTEELEVADAELLALFTGDDRIKRLTAIPGIGFTTAATVLAEIGDPARFSSPDRLRSWAGLTPTEHSSAEHTRRGHISKQGSRWLRRVIIEAAFPALRNSHLHHLYAGIAARRGAKIARVAVARRLLTLAFYALRDQRGCRAYPITSCA